MRKIIYSYLVSLDGYLEKPDGSLDWTVPDEQLHQHFNDLEASLGLLIYGRRMYELMSAYWPTADQDPAASPVEVEYAHIWQQKPKLVFSRTLKQVSHNARLDSGGDLAALVRELKAQPGGDISVGGANLAASFMALDLIDEYCLYVHPVILGGGKPMFPPLPKPMQLELLETRQFNSGVVMLRYGKAGN